MAKHRWIVPWAETETAVCHCISRVVDERFAFGVGDKEQFRMHPLDDEEFSYL